MNKSIKTPKEETVTLSKKDFDLLTSIFPKLSGLKQQLEIVVHPKYIEEINVISNTVETVMSPFWDTEEDARDKNFNQLSEISDQNKIKTVWSISEVSALQLDDKCPYPVKNIHYSGNTITFNKSKKVLWIDMWKAADELIRRSEDDHHIFIEGFDEDKNNPGNYYLITGS